MFILTISSLLLVVAMGIGLYLKAAPILEEHSLWDLLSASEWKPMKNQFGFFPFLMGTLWVSALVLILDYELVCPPPKVWPIPWEFQSLPYPHLKLSLSLI